MCFKDFFFKVYLEAVATGSTGLVANVSSIQKDVHPQLAVQSKSVRLGSVSSLFPVHTTGPLNTIGKTHFYIYRFALT